MKELNEKLNKLSLSEAEKLLDQEMDEVVGAGNCYCSSGALSSLQG